MVLRHGDHLSLIQTSPPPLLLPVNELLCVVNNLYKSVHAADASGHTRLRDVCVEISNVRAAMKILPIKVYIREI